MSKQDKYSGRKIYRRIFVRRPKSNKMSIWQFYGLTGFVVIFIIGLFGFSKFITDLTSGKDKKIQKQISLTSSSTESVFAGNKLSVSNLPKNNFSSPQIRYLRDSSNNTSLNSEFTYNASTPPQFQKSDKLTKIVNRIVKYTKNKKLPVEKLSITLIDPKNKTASGYKQNTPRYPASVVKMFWMVALYAKAEKGLIQLNETVENQLKLMIVESDNDAGGQIIDVLTNTKSSHRKLNKTDLKKWKNKRNQINLFFQEAGYKEISLNQKTFPLLFQNFPKPIGPDLQIRRSKNRNPIRNKITTNHAARLMYEISSNQAVANNEYSQRIFNLLTRDIKYWKAKPPNPMDFNPVESFLGESLPYKKAEIISKAGITSRTRIEVAFITTKDRKTKYILAVSGNDRAYVKNNKIFPGISRLVYKQMTSSQ